MREIFPGANSGMPSEKPAYYQVYKYVSAALNSCCASSAAAGAEARIILASAAGVDFSKIMATMWRDPVEADAWLRINDILRLRKAGKPIQYILGEAEFFGLDFKVCEAVLIPRHDTECVVEAVINHAAGVLSGPGAPCGLRVLDIGTGSGVIAVCVALAFKGRVKVTAVDLSHSALECAAANAGALGAADYIDFIESDIYSAVAAASKFDIIASNPPYISQSEYSVLPREVRQEPKMALIAECGGYEFYEKILGGAYLFLNGGGAVFFETGYKMAEGVIKIASTHGFKNHELIYDVEVRNRGLKLWR